MVIYNKTYSPDFNPIECVFSVVKNQYKRERFMHENNSIVYQQQTLIERAFRIVKTSGIRNSINHSMRLLGIPEVDRVFPKTAAQRLS